MLTRIAVHVLGTDRSRGVDCVAEAEEKVLPELPRVRVPSYPSRINRLQIRKRRLEGIGVSSITRAMGPLSIFSECDLHVPNIRLLGHESRSRAGPCLRREDMGM